MVCQYSFDEFDVRKIQRKTEIAMNGFPMYKMHNVIEIKALLK